MRREMAIVFVAALVAASGGIAAVNRAGNSATVKSASSAGPQLAGIATGKTRVVDMTYAISGQIPSWPGDEHAFQTQIVATPEKDGYFARSFSMPEHFGTHMDAPSHFPPGKMTLDEIPAERLFGPAVVIDASAEAAKNADYRLMVTPIHKWEALHGRIPAGAIVLLRTGWGSRWPDPARYRNMDTKGVMHFPGYSVEAAKLLVERGAIGLGIDTLSVDYGPSQNFEVHHVDLPAGLYNIENLANLDRLPEAGAFLIAAPIKLAGGSGGACRVFALLP